MKKILLIEDDPDIHLMIKYTLMRVGYELISAYNGEEGLEKVLTEEPDLILLDNMMPKLSGEEVFNRLMTDEKYENFRHIPVVMLTARHTEEEKIESLLQQGMAAFLFKPFGKNELLNVIQNIFTTHRIRWENEQLLKATQEASDFLTQLVHSIPDALFIISPEGKIAFYNGAERDKLGYSVQKLVGQAFDRIIAPGFPSFAELKEQLQDRKRINNMEIHLLSKSGQAIPFRLSASEFRGKNGETVGYIFIGADVSEIKELERKLIEKEKMAMFLETAVTVNHEINNPLSPILGNVQLLLQDADRFDEQTRKRLEVIQRNARRIQEIVKKLRSIKEPKARTYVGQTTMVDLEESR
jgi:PAS domain S-box-containing protein